MKASNYGLANLKRIVPQLRTWTTSPGEDYSDLQELYDNVVGQWGRYAGHVTTIVGGVNEVRKSSDQAGAVYEPVAKARQQAAVAWLSDNVFATPTWMIDPEILGRLENNGTVERVRATPRILVTARMACSRPATSGTLTFTTNDSSPATNQQSSTAGTAARSSATLSSSALSDRNTPTSALIE